MSEQDYELDPAEVQTGAEPKQTPDENGVTIDVVVADTDGDGIPDGIDPVDDTVLDVPA